MAKETNTQRVDRLSDKLHELDKEVEVLDYKVKTVKDDLTDLERITVKIAEFDPVKKLVFGLVGIILTGVMGAIIGGVLVS